MKRFFYLFFGCLAIALIAFIIVCNIGIPSRLADKNIDAKTLADIKEVTPILINHRIEVLSKDTSSSSDKWMPDAYGYIDKQMVDSLFKYLSNTQRQKIRALFQNKEVYKIDMARQDCIRFYIKISRYNEFYTSDMEAIDLVYDQSPQYDCNTVAGDNNTIIDIKKFRPRLV